MSRSHEIKKYSWTDRIIIYIFRGIRIKGKNPLFTDVSGNVWRKTKCPFWNSGAGTGEVKTNMKHIRMKISNQSFHTTVFEEWRFYGRLFM